MKKSLAIISLFIFISFIGDASAFTCGPNFQTYSVQSDSGLAGIGIRCVRRYSSNSYLWYGEGIWNPIKYRHIGEIVHMVGGPRVYFADIYGNKEDTAGRFYGNVNVQIDPYFSNYPDWFKFTGAINETWTKQGDDYLYHTVVGKVVEQCGPNYDKYIINSSYGSGVRCIMRKIVDGKHIWYGQGEWNGRSYAHMGSFKMNGIGYAYDICPDFFDSCNPGKVTLKMNSDKGNIIVSGAWSETWVKAE